MVYPCIDTRATKVRTWVTNEIVTAAQLNQEIRDNLGCFAAIIAYTDGTLLSGWADYSATAGGRYIVATPTSGTTGGTVGSALTNLQNKAAPTHTHTGPSHTHTGPSHTHTGPSHTHTGPSHTHNVPGTTANTGHAAGADDKAAAASAGGTFTWANDISTGAAGTGATGAEGTGATGANGTGATGAEGTGNTGVTSAVSTGDIAPFIHLLAMKKSA